MFKIHWPTFHSLVFEVNKPSASSSSSSVFFPRRPKRDTKSSIASTTKADSTFRINTCGPVIIKPETEKDHREIQSYD